MIYIVVSVLQLNFAFILQDCDIDKTEEPSNLKGQSSFFPEVKFSLVFVNSIDP